MFVRQTTISQAIRKEPKRSAESRAAILISCPVSHTSAFREYAKEEQT